MARPSPVYVSRVAGVQCVLTEVARSELTALGLTATQVRVVGSMLARWLIDPDATRAEFAETLRMRDSSLRTQITEIRSKLRLGKRRGVEPLVAWLAEREMLTSEASLAAVVLLASR